MDDLLYIVGTKINDFFYKQLVYKQLYLMLKND